MEERELFALLAPHDARTRANVLNHRGVGESSTPTALSSDGQTPRRQPREAQVAAAH